MGCKCAKISVEHLRIKVNSSQYVEMINDILDSYVLDADYIGERV